MVAVRATIVSLCRGDFPSMEESCPGSAIWSLKNPQGATGGSSPLEPTSTAPLQMQPRHPRAAQACFLGPQAQVSSLAEQPSWPPPEQRGVREFMSISHDGGTETPLTNSSLFLYCPRKTQELSLYHAVCLCPGLSCHLQRSPEQHF